MGNDFLPLKGNFRNLIIFQKAECIFDVTYYFANKYLSGGDRTVDQMVQAARSGKQNIAEGCSASTTSKETEIKLINVAKASFRELLLDYEDYLRTHNLEIWDIKSEKSLQARTVCSAHIDSAFYRDAIKLRNDEAISNIAITLLHQEDLLLLHYLDRVKEDYLKNGGIREEMYQARREYRNNHPESHSK